MRMAPIGRRPAHRRPSLPSSLFAAVLLAGILVVGLNGWRTWEAKVGHLEADRAETANLARSLAQHAHDSIQSVDILLLGLRERIVVDGATRPTLDRLRAIMQARVAQLPGLLGLFVYDADGNWVVTSAAIPAGAPNNADRTYFEFHRTHADSGPYVGSPIRSRSDGSWVITVSRRVDGPDGRFAGVALATLSIRHLADFYAGLDVGPRGILSLVTADGVLVARKPYDPAMVGRDLSASETFRRLLPQASEGSLAERSLIDGVERIGSYRRTPEFPLVVVVAHAVDDVLAGWRADAILHLGISLVLAGGLALLGYHVSRQVRRTQDAERRYRLLADNSSDAILCLDRDFMPLYVSPAFAALTGWTPAEAAAQPWDALAHPDDAALLTDARARLDAGEQGVTVAYRAGCRGDAFLWVEARLRLVAEPGDDRAACIASIRDVSQRQAAEAKLAAANRELDVLARTDALTGIANRRRFDEALQDEWRRGAREETPLSLLMVDVDRFKLFNDRHGHLAGDDCLRRVAQAIESVARRPGDLVARYGGEEIVLLLPGTDSVGAHALAERVCAAVRALEITHPGNLPRQVVTVSVGAATRLPRLPAGRPVGAGVVELTGAADTALYQAKNGGRDRVVVDADLPVAPLPPIRGDEPARLVALARHNPGRVGSQIDCLDRLALLTAALFQVPVALVSLVEQDTQCFVGRAGTTLDRLPRSSSFCAHAIAGEGVFSVADASMDPRFAANPLVTGEMALRFYAGAPLRERDGHVLGTLCILDRVPRAPLLPEQKALLRDLAEIAVSHLEALATQPLPAWPA